MLSLKQVQIQFVLPPCDDFSQ